MPAFLIVLVAVFFPFLEGALELFFEICGNAWGGRVKGELCAGKIDDAIPTVCVGWTEDDESSCSRV